MISKSIVRWCAQLSVVFSLTWCAFGAAKIYYVNASGDNSDGSTVAKGFNQISTAVTHVASDYTNNVEPVGGEVIDVVSGTYNGFNIATTATAANPIVIQWYNGGTQPTITNFSNFGGINFQLGSAYITLQGFVIVGQNQYITLSDAQYYENDPDHNPYYNTSCVNIDGSTGPGTENQPGSKTNHPVHITINENSIYNCPGAAIATRQADWITVSYNNIYNNSLYSAYADSGITFLNEFNSDNQTGQKMFIIGNRIFGNQELIPNHAVQPTPYISDGEGIIIDSNENASTVNNITPYIGTTVIENNVVYDNGSNGIEIYNSNHVVVASNSTYGNVQATGSPLGPNWNQRPEMEVNGATTDINIVNNVFVSTLSTNYPVCVTAGSAGATYLSHNVYFNVALGSGTMNCSSTPVGTFNQIANPFYVQATPIGGNQFTVNLAPKAGSIALSAGYNNFYPTYDFNYFLRNNTTTAGAYNGTTN